MYYINRHSIRGIRGIRGITRGELIMLKICLLCYAAVLKEIRIML